MPIFLALDSSVDVNECLLAHGLDFGDQHDDKPDGDGEILDEELEKLRPPPYDFSKFIINEDGIKAHITKEDPNEYLKDIYNTPKINFGTTNYTLNENYKYVEVKNFSLLDLVVTKKKQPKKKKNKENKTNLNIPRGKQITNTDIQVKETEIAIGEQNINIFDIVFMQQNYNRIKSNVTTEVIVKENLGEDVSHKQIYPTFIINKESAIVCNDNCNTLESVEFETDIGPLKHNSILNPKTDKYNSQNRITYITHSTDGKIMKRWKELGITCSLFNLKPSLSPFNKLRRRKRPTKLLAVSKLSKVLQSNCLGSSVFTTKSIQKYKSIQNTFSTTQNEPMELITVIKFVITILITVLLFFL